MTTSLWSGISTVKIAAKFEILSIYSAVKCKKKMYSKSKSPLRMQKHLEKLPPVPFDQQIIRACDWLQESLLYDERILCICQDVPPKLQDGPQ